VDLFEFILIITSVIYAMSVANILSGVSRLAQSDARIQWFLPHTIWMFTVFVYIFLVWWGTWEFRGIEWKFPSYLFMAIMPTLVYLACSLLVPQRLNGSQIDLETHYFRIRKPFFWSFLVATILAVTDGSILDDEPLWFPGRIGHVIFLTGIFAGLLTDNKRWHVAISVLALLALGYIAVSRLWNPR
jgi:hypothetical protein